MKKSTKYIGIGITVIAIIVAGLYGLWMYHTHRLYEETYTSEYNYLVTVKTDSILHNVTLYLPLPVFEGESKIGDKITAGNISKPDDWDCSVIETQYGKMLKISAKKMIPETRYSYTRISVRLRSDHEINSKNPIGNEPVLSPKEKLTGPSTYRYPRPQEAERQLPPDYYDYIYSEYKTYVYADYATSLNANLSIFIELSGSNHWWVYGWGGNYYDDKINIKLTGEQHGWHIASGKLVEGIGDYNRY